MSAKKSAKLWQKSDTALHPKVSAYITDPALSADNALFSYDIRASRAHVGMLGKVGLLATDEVKDLRKALKDLAEQHARGEFVLKPESEDMHTAIEQALVEKLGDVGKKVHVGRSRNDQILVAMRLFSKEALGSVVEETTGLASALLDFAKAHEFVPMPGFTHMQPAMPSSVGQWIAAFAESLICDRDLLRAAQNLNDQNPLGSAAGFGTGIPVDREATAEELGFSRVQITPLFCQNSRGKFEAFTIHCLLQVMLTLGRLANDLVLFTSPQFGFFKVAPNLTTGSSIMPQKQNLDIMEVLRANVAVMQSLQLQVQTVSHNLISGYNKDTKITKKPLIEAFNITRQSLDIMKLLFEGLSPNEPALLAAFEDPEIFAADEANRLVQEGLSFRDAYQQVGENLGNLQGQDPAQNIKLKTHIGATGNLCLDQLRSRL